MPQKLLSILKSAWTDPVWSKVIGGIILAAGALIASLLLTSTKSPDSARALVGTWKGVTNAKSSNGELIASGYTRLLETGQYSYTGDIEVRAPNGSTVTYTALAAGTWNVSGNRFVLVASDIKTVPRTLKTAEKGEFDLTDALRVPQQLLPRLEDVTPKGTSQEYLILELTSDRLRAKSSDLRGSLVTYDATRQ